MSDRLELLTIEDRIQIGSRGVYLIPDFSVPKALWKDWTEKVTIISPGGVAFEATADFGLSHFNIPDPKVPLDARWRVVVVITDRKKEEMPVGSKVLASPEVIRALELGESNKSTQRIRASHATRRINPGPLDPLL